jgi:hypothetical protein
MNVSQEMNKLIDRFQPMPSTKTNRDRLREQLIAITERYKRETGEDLCVELAGEYFPVTDWSVEDINGQAVITPICDDSEIETAKSEFITIHLVVK